MIGPTPGTLFRTNAGSNKTGQVGLMECAPEDEQIKH
jgi:hypothetical protein